MVATSNAGSAFAAIRFGVSETAGEAAPVCARAALDIPNKIAARAVQPVWTNRDRLPYSTLRITRPVMSPPFATHAMPMQNGRK
jgi:hypothetical protein